MCAFAGKGTYVWKDTGCLYDGDWKKGKRSGFGTLSYPDGKGGYIKEYSGGWKNDLRHVGLFHQTFGSTITDHHCSH